MKNEKIALALFLQWRSPRFGHSNPTRMDNPVWKRDILSKLEENEEAEEEEWEGPSSQDAGPAWFFDRFGQSVTALPDGRVLYIAGQCECFYDPDFYIYNDVVVVHPDRSIEIYGYPRETFLPTDFHSATLLGNQIALIGNLGYPQDRSQAETPVYLLETDTYQIRQVQTQGERPGWIHGHVAELQSDQKTIRITKGKRDNANENIDDWQLNTESWHWERLTHRQWPRWKVQRADRGCNHLSRLRIALSHSTLADFQEDFVTDIQELTEKLGAGPNLSLVKELYVPPVPHERLPRVEEEYNVRRLRIAGVIVRYVETRGSIHVTVEGELPIEIIHALKDDLCQKFSVLENTPCVSAWISDEPQG